MLQTIPRKIKIAVIVALLLIVVAAVVYGIYTQTTRAGKIAVAVDAVPSDANITIDGVKVSPGTIYLKPDHTYAVKVQKDGFETTTQEQYVSSDQNTIFVGLYGVSEEAKKWAEENQDKYLELEGKGSDAANDEGIAFADKNPITQVLPYENLIYSIGYRIDQSDQSGNTIILTIDTTEGFRNAAVQQIRDLGYDPTQYKIEFNDYKNPFAL